MQMWHRLGQVPAGFWGSHLSTDVVQTKEGEFGVGYLGPGGLRGCLTWAQTRCKPGGGFSGAFRGSHLGTDAAQAKVTVWGETQQGLGGFYLDADPVQARGGVSLGHRHGAGQGVA